MSLNWVRGLACACVVSACVGDSTVPQDGGADATADIAPQDVTTKDSGGGGDVATEQPPWSPTDLSGLALWLTGDTATQDVSSKVSTWTDQSPNHNDAKQTTEANAPYFAAAGINGHKAIHFDHAASTFLVLADTASLQWNHFVIEFVLRHAAATGAEWGTLYIKQSTTAPYAGPVVDLLAVSSPYATYVSFQTDGNTAIGSKTTTVLPDTVAHRLHVSWDGSNLAIQIDKGAPFTGTGSSTGTGAVGAMASIGCNGTAGMQCLNGDIAEIVAVAGTTINSSDITTLESYLDTKYGL